MTDAQWARIEPLLADRAPKRGGRWRDHRQVIDAIAVKYRLGTPWTDLPEHFGSWKGAHNQLRKWAADGTWERGAERPCPRTHPRQADHEDPSGCGQPMPAACVRPHAWAGR
ncbi:transposase [Streptomyces sp. BG9H]|uniref:Transposase n=1 Tax=Streptomyces anatolicus TaxID=2675858 RepID=A0ABS6YJP1_9ACTN|nr:transposase [Streptomyces anatolicus]